MKAQPSKRLSAKFDYTPKYERERTRAAIRHLKRHGFVITMAKQESDGTRDKKAIPRAAPIAVENPQLLRALFKLRKDHFPPDMVSEPALQEIVVQGILNKFLASCGREKKKRFIRELAEWFLEYAESAEPGLSHTEQQRLKKLKRPFRKDADGPAIGLKTQLGRQALTLASALRTTKRKQEKILILSRHLDALSDPDFCRELATANRFLSNQPKARVWLTEYSILQGAEGKYTRNEICSILGITERALRKINRDLRRNHNVHIPFKEDRLGRPRKAGT